MRFIRSVPLQLLSFLLALGVTSAPQAIAITPSPLSPYEDVSSGLARLGETAAQDRAVEMAVHAFTAGDYAFAVDAWEALAGHQATAHYYLGVAYATGKGVPADWHHALVLWREAAEMGSIDAQYNLGLVYYEGQGVRRDIAQASHWWEMAALRGDPAAQFQLGALLYDVGDGAEIPSDTITWWRQSARQGFEPAIKALEILNVP